MGVSILIQLWYSKRERSSKFGAERCWLHQTSTTSLSLNIIAKTKWKLPLESVEKVASKTECPKLFQAGLNYHSLKNTNHLLFHLGCLSFGSIGTLSGVTEIWTITCIVLERKRKICMPLEKSGRLSNNQINIMILSVWSMGIFVSILPLLNINRYVLEVKLEFFLSDSASYTKNVCLCVTNVWLCKLNFKCVS